MIVPLTAGVGERLRQGGRGPGKRRRGERAALATVRKGDRVGQRQVWLDGEICRRNARRSTAWARQRVGKGREERGKRVDAGGRRDLPGIGNEFFDIGLRENAAGPEQHQVVAGIGPAAVKAIATDLERDRGTGRKRDSAACHRTNRW